MILTDITYNYLLKGFKTKRNIYFLKHLFSSWFIFHKNVPVTKI